MSGQICRDWGTTDLLFEKIKDTAGDGGRADGKRLRLEAYKGREDCLRMHYPTTRKAWPAGFESSIDSTPNRGTQGRDKAQELATLKGQGTVA